jgi:hypothetical protein
LSYGQATSSGVYAAISATGTLAAQALAYGQATSSGVYAAVSATGTLAARALAYGQATSSGAYAAISATGTLAAQALSYGQATSSGVYAAVSATGTLAAQALAYGQATSSGAYAGLAGKLSASGNLITVSSITFICLSAAPSPLVEHQIWVLCSDSQAYITQNGAAVKLSTGTSGGGGSGNVLNSAVTCAMTQTTISNRSALDTCVTGSNLTITTGGHIIVYFTGAALNAGNALNVVGFMVDGSATFGPYTTTLGVTHTYVSNWITQMDYTTPPLAITPGSHTFCLTGWAPNSNTLYLPYTAANNYSQTCFGVLSLP